MKIDEEYENEKFQNNIENFHFNKRYNNYFLQLL